MKEKPIIDVEEVKPPAVAPKTKQILLNSFWPKAKSMDKQNWLKFYDFAPLNTSNKIYNEWVEDMCLKLRESDSFKHMASHLVQERAKRLWKLKDKLKEEVLIGKNLFF